MENLHVIKIHKVNALGLIIFLSVGSRVGISVSLLKAKYNKNKHVCRHAPGHFFFFNIYKTTIAP